MSICATYGMSFNPNRMEGGGGGGGGWLKQAIPAEFSEKCPCSHNNKTAVIQQISLLDTA